MLRLLIWLKYLTLQELRVNSIHLACKELQFTGGDALCCNSGDVGLISDAGLSLHCHLRRIGNRVYSTPEGLMGGEVMPFVTQTTHCGWLKSDIDNL